LFLSLKKEELRVGGLINWELERIMGDKTGDVDSGSDSNSWGMNLEKSA